MLRNFLIPNDPDGSYPVIINNSGLVAHLSPDMIAYHVNRKDDVKFVGFGY